MFFCYSNLITFANPMNIGRLKMAEIRKYYSISAAKVRNQRLQNEERSKICV